MGTRKEAAIESNMLPCRPNDPVNRIVPVVGCHRPTPNTGARLSRKGPVFRLGKLGNT